MKRLFIWLILLSIVATGCAEKSRDEEGNEEKAQKVSITVTEARFDPNQIDAKAGKIEFYVTNKGKQTHEFEIFKEGKLVDEVEGITPGLTRELEVELEAGTYEFKCLEPGHEEAGEKGTITVS